MLKDLKQLLDPFLKYFSKTVRTSKPLPKLPFSLPSNVFNNSRPWHYIIVHHSLSTDGVERNFEQLKKYHMSYRIDGTIIETKEEFERRKSKKDGKLFQEPWGDVGYNFLIEKVGEKYEVIVGRPLSSVGTHCMGMNAKAIGICCVGNFDKAEPPQSLYWLLVLLIVFLRRKFTIPLDNIRPHRDYAPKSCPGSKFSMNKLKELIINQEKIYKD